MYQMDVEALSMGRKQCRSAMCPLVRCGAPEGTRTPNLLIRSQMLYPLSYGRMFCCQPAYFDHPRRLRDSNPGGGVTPNRISSAAP
jgi:hypothetical protein